MGLTFSLQSPQDLQDVVRCHLCETQTPPSHCVICNIHLCEDCKGKHLSDESKEHKVVPFKYKRSFPKCQNHSTKICEFYCKQCNISICALCVSYKEHQTHDVLDILKTLKSKSHAIEKDLQELKEFIYPDYQKFASYFTAQKADLNHNSQLLIKTINKHEEDLHRVLNNITKTLKSDLNEMDSKHLAALNKQEDEITRSISEINQSIADLKTLQDSNDVSLLSAYKSRNLEFRGLPLNFSFSFPTFTPQIINKEQVGHISATYIKSEELGYTTDSTGADTNSNRPLTDEPRIIREINTEFESFNSLRCVSCLSDKDTWTSGKDNTMRLHNFQGELEKSIRTKSGNMPQDIAVTRNRDLVYTDYIDRTVNIVKKTRIQTLKTLQGWRPHGVCSTFSGDLLVVIVSDDFKQTKVVRYPSFINPQSIQYNDKWKPLYSSYGYKYITENRNLDICVSDYGARAVVVVNQAGKLRFRYTGTPCTTKVFFNPHSITTDSQGRILTSDCDNNCIHIIDQNGQFLCYIDNCHLQNPRGLCVDTKDNLFVAEYDTGKVKKIQYCL